MPTALINNVSEGDSHCSGGRPFLFALIANYRSRFASYDEEKDGENNKNNTDRQCHETEKKENKGEDEKEHSVCFDSL